MAYNIFFTGGGSGGHVIPAITLIQEVQRILPSSGMPWAIKYIGGKTIEAQLIPPLGITYYTIQTGKLRRYFSWQNFTDVFRICLGIWQTFWILWHYRKDKNLICAMGGFVAVPVVVAAYLWRCKIVVHEQTCQAGLANRIAAKLADEIWLSFGQSKKFFPPDKTVLTGYPVRPSCFTPRPSTLVIQGKDLATIEKPILFVTGGGNGSALLNDWVKENLTWLSEKFFIVHQVGRLQWPQFKDLGSTNYLPLDLLGPEIIELFKLATLVISRSGAGTVCELMALKKRSIFIPLKIAQHQEQAKNAQAAQNMLGSLVLHEDEFKTMNAPQILARWESSSTGVSHRDGEAMVFDSPAEKMAQRLVEKCQK